MSSCVLWRAALRPPHRLAPSAPGRFAGGTLVSLAASLALVLGAPSAQALTFSSLAVDDGHATSTGSGFDELDTTLFVSLVFRSDSSSTERRGLFEYDISSIPGGIVVTSAIFSAQTSNEAGQFDVHGYVGDGVLTLADATAGDGNIVAQFPGGDPTTKTIPLDVVWVQSLVDASDPFLGLNVRGRPGVAFSSHQIATKEISSADARAARLTIEYVVPEPGTAALLAMGMLGVAFARRRRR